MNKLYDFVVDSPIKVMARRVGAKHGEMLYSADGYVTAWFMWHLQGVKKQVRHSLGIMQKY